MHCRSPVCEVVQIQANPSKTFYKDPKITELVYNESALLQISKLFTCPHVTMSLASTMSQAVVVHSCIIFLCCLDGEMIHTEIQI